MSIAVRSSTSPDCISDLRFDEWFAGELDASASETLCDHLTACARCRERKAALERERARFAASELAAPTWLVPAAQSGRARARGWRKLAFPTVAAAACALLALANSQPNASSVRSKGEGALQFYVKRGDLVQRWEPGAALQPGDRLRFAYTAPRARYLAILSLDPERRASVYYPQGARAVQIDPGSDVLLPSAVELDTSIGDEQLLGLFCDSPVQLVPLLAQLEQEQLAFQPPAGCVVDRLAVTKRAPP